MAKTIIRTCERRTTLGKCTRKVGEIQPLLRCLQSVKTKIKGHVFPRRNSFEDKSHLSTRRMENIANFQKKLSFSFWHTTFLISPHLKIHGSSLFFLSPQDLAVLHLFLLRQKVPGVFSFSLSLQTMALQPDKRRRKKGTSTT